MKLTKKQEKEVLKVYDRWLNSYLNGDVQTYDSYLDDEYRFIGSTNNEDFLNRKDTTKFFEETVDQLAGKVEIRNNRRTIEKFEELVFITDLFDAYFLNKKAWAYYGNFRFTSALKKNEEGWRFIYQHFSTPDSKAQEGETLGTEQIAAENLQLREAVQRRTIELEQKNRELEVETALERVRAVALSMTEPSDMLDVCRTLSEQMEELKITDIRNVQTAIVDDAKGTYLNFEYYRLHDKSLTTEVDYKLHPVLSEFAQQMLKSSKSFFTASFEGAELKEWIDHQRKTPQFIDSHLENATSLNYYFHSTGPVALGISTYSPLTKDGLEIFKRFRNVFELTYRRFNDIKIAEAQTREAQIEAALERVRSKTMAMHNSQDVGATVVTLFDEVLKLGIDKSIRVGIGILKGYEGMETWSATSNPKGEVDLKMGMLDMTIHPMLIGLKKAWKEGKKGYRYDYIGEDVFRYYEALNREPEYPFQADLDALPENEYHKSFFYTEGILFSFAPNPISEEASMVLDRFARVFGQTYRRYRDLQKAEAQAREAQIEAALERVRSTAMAMHSSEDLATTVDAFFSELTALNVTPHRCGMGIIDSKTRIVNIHSTTNNDNKETNRVTGMLTLAGHPVLDNIFENWKLQKEYHPVLKGNEILDYYKSMDPEIIFPAFDKDEIQYGYYFYFKEGGVYAWTDKELEEKDLQIFRRYNSVLSLTYRRYIDLKDAEEQAREALIEAGLERVRSRTLAMQNSDELPETAAVVFKQLIDLGIAPNRLFIGIINDKNKAIDFWLIDDKGTKVSEQFTGDSNRNASINKMYEGWKKKKKSITIDIKGKELEKYFQYMGVELKVPFKHGLLQKRRVQNISYFSNGFIGLASINEQPEETTTLLERFAAVFNLTYARFSDLKLSEAQAREARTERALEKVRARALAMQQPEELKEVAQVMRQEMGMLGVEELETSSIYINDEKSHEAECWYAIKDVKQAEKKLVSDHFELDLNDTWVGKEMLKFYKSAKKQISIEMKGAERKEWIHYCEEKSVAFRGYYGKIIPERTYHLYKFSHGAIGAATPGDFSAENWGLLKRAASVFSLAYSRFKDLTQARYDLQQLKEEKKRAEDALSELKTTQSQLIHAEKMASLGELTAGIAHEIQNPLNFVNNFAEVNNELIEELKEEIDSGDLEEVKAIAEDIAGNEQKILHHGKRADAIVKGMLQHSRKTVSNKELTDINLLADEYLRLSYHGLRAKDKTFNADFRTEFDKSLPKVSLIGQDIGRVLLNLINNAFYAVNERAKQNEADYKPVVVVSTKKLADKFEIRVKDNGKGIPDKVMEKIFQPFFTTKPTGEGTGLGLSLSYDIVTKGHGGELKAVTKKDEGTEFIILLNMNN